MEKQPVFGEFCFNELATGDVKAAKDFYGKVFGWQFEEHNMGDSSYTMIKHNGKDIGAGIWSIPQDMQKQVPPHWASYILVENIEKALELAVKNGAKIVKGATKAGQFGILAIILDPTGAHVALWQALKQ